MSVQICFVWNWMIIYIGWTSLQIFCTCLTNNWVWLNGIKCTFIIIFVTKYYESILDWIEIWWLYCCTYVNIYLIIEIHIILTSKLCALAEHQVCKSKLHKQIVTNHCIWENFTVHFILQKIHLVLCTQTWAAYQNLMWHSSWEGCVQIHSSSYSCFSILGSASY